jgi:YHS domain-containing protein
VARLILFLVLAVVIARTFWRFVDGFVRGAVGPAPQGGPRAGGPPASVKMQQCPVCDTYVVPGKAISLVSGGTTLYFDSEKCRAEYQSR